ncbi:MULTISPECIES: RNA polymerase sigma factor [Tenacibaculum]|uniref:RNA polymerase sigma factor n=1 Tax=Tenacibaculum TaxID=104267 RepID=UPI000894E09C|nr:MULTISPECIES: sigma-70 family RNA polymerase sigma factor [unclassified Tenacibaculum]RBW60776.1 sigma-70 family RNA polymerase sigma factor [Tenacibaculum sp. E3R01]SEE56692.1 RNA polymerase sigma factor, sigma-70 family [Tenacibaculum sp. MAR_2010_89]
MSNLSDDILWKSLKEGDLKAFSVLFKKFYPPLFSYGLKISKDPVITEDSLQDFFVYIFEHKENLSDLDKIAPYLFSSYRRFIIKRINKIKKYSIVRNIDKNIVDINFTPEEFITNQESTTFRNKNLTKLVNELPKRQKEVIYLKFHCNLKAKEIAETMDINYQSVINILHKAIKNLREEMAILQLLNS